ncbi:hypothetical protein [Legionella maioricensis]|uniref:SidC homolog n=1 Tax=Legionella maioricensis TaxID=2896528 RepID=A0A9X2D0L7_9GAMM|nr:hypothetical protein [Legionella maioricensis]MCL9683667.1 hypothetical protein [Legionella maioricensis]MCL9687689.1 hypothetical protein [Legionella maioricensis]
MESILKDHPEDLLVSRRLRDISGAEFNSITLLQHAMWAKDVRYMANMMLDCLPKNEQGEQIRLELVRQYEELMAKGLVYKLKGEWHENERHFNLQSLKTALNTYVTNHNNWSEEQRREHWCTVVGLVQTLIPAHIRHHYCDPEEAFWDNTNFAKPKLTRLLGVYSWDSTELQLWSESLVGLGSSFGIYHAVGFEMRWHNALSVGQPTMHVEKCIASNLAALTALDETRTGVDLPALIERLYTPIHNLEDDLDAQGIKL